MRRVLALDVPKCETVYNLPWIFILSDKLSMPIKMANVFCVERI